MTKTHLKLYLCNTQTFIKTGIEEGIEEVRLYLYCVVSDAPEFTRHPEDIVQNEGQVVTFKCSVEGNPQPSIKWTKNNEILNAEANPKLNASSSGNTHSLRIQEVHRSDEGQYRCVANNSIGNITSTAGILEVHCE